MNQRCLAILDLLNREDTLDVNGLAERLNVSAVTIRKDLTLLENMGLLQRTHGYATRITPNNTGYHMTLEYEAKHRIAQRAANMVSSGETVMLESGSTCALLAEELVRNKKGVMIVTNSAFIAGHVRLMSGAHVVLLGGNYDSDTQVMSGPLISKCVEGFYVDKFFIGTEGFDPDQGFFGIDLFHAEAIRAMTARADKRIILADASKFHKRGRVQLMPTSLVTHLVTDSIPEHCRLSLTQNGVEVILAA